MMIEQPGDPKASTSVGEVEFSSGFPSGPHLGEFEIKVLMIEDMTSPVTMRATLDLSRQYGAEGSQWIATEQGAGFEPGITIPRDRVEGWRQLEPPSSASATLVDEQRERYDRDSLALERWVDEHILGDETV